MPHTVQFLGFNAAHRFVGMICNSPTKPMNLDLNYICLFNYLFISSQMSAKPYFIGSTGILLLW